MGVVVAIAVVALIGVVVLTRARRPAETEWSRTKGTVLSATVQMSPSESPLVFYTYQVNGEVFRGHRVRRQQRACAAASVIARYPAGSSVVVYYDPSDPANSALEL